MEYRLSSQANNALIKRMLLLFLFTGGMVTLGVMVAHKQKPGQPVIIPLAVTLIITSAVVWRQTSVRLKNMRDHVAIIGDGKVRFPNGAMALDFDLSKVNQATILKRHGKPIKIELRSETKTGICLEGYEDMDKLTGELMALIPREKLVIKDK